VLLAAGVTHDPLFCYPPWELSFPNSTEQQRLDAVARLTQDLVKEMAAVLGVAPQVRRDSHLLLCTGCTGPGEH
jgi:hypothetical protein